MVYNNKVNLKKFDLNVWGLKNVNNTLRPLSFILKNA